jgi:hypothetical protein
MGVYINSYIYSGGWSPTDEASLEAWYKKDTGITESGGDVSNWADQSSNGIDMAQLDAAEQPTYGSSVITFDGTQSLQSTGQITLTGEFTIGFVLNITTFGDTFLADNTTANQVIKFMDNDTLRFKTANGSTDINLDSGSTFSGSDYIVLTRDSSNVLNLWLNGVLQVDTGSKGGNSLIDTIGARFTDIDRFRGNATEIQIFNSKSTTLTTNINTRLATL